jgi:hypothetical protein
MVDVEALVREGAKPGVHIRQWKRTEPPQTLRMLPTGSSPPPLRAVETTVSLLDVTDPSYAFRNRHLVDGQGRVIYEAKVVPSFHVLRVALVPLEQPRRVSGTVAYLSNTKPGNYSHWLFFSLPLIRYYREMLGKDPDFYYVGSPCLREHFESLEMLGIPPSRVLEYGVTADRLLTVVADRAGGVDQDFLLFARENLGSRSAVSTQTTGRRLFISRKGAAHRRLVNEAECARVLRDSFGFELIATENMNLREEIALFQEASVVVATHGAGLANIAFTPKGTPVLELASRTYWDPLFAEIAGASDDPYGIVWGAPAGNYRRTPPAEHDFVVDIGELEAAVSLALQR